MYVINNFGHTNEKGRKSMRIEILLKEVRKKKGYSLEKLSKLTGISSSHLNYIENNSKEPTISVLVRISLALNVKIEELYRVIP